MGDWGANEEKNKNLRVSKVQASDARGMEQGERWWGEKEIDKCGMSVEVEPAGFADKLGLTAKEGIKVNLSNTNSSGVR